MGCGSGLFTWLGVLFGYVVQLFYNMFSNYGVAIILFTIITRLLMFPLTIKQQKSTAAQARIKPKMDELKRRFGNDQKGYNEAVQELYNKEGVSPTAGCLPMLIQFPLFFGMYEAIRSPLTCVLHVSKEKIAQLTELFGLAGGKTSNYYNEIYIIQKIRDGFTSAVTSATDLVSASSVTASDVVSNTSAVVNDVIVSGSNAIASASDVVSGGDLSGVISILGDNYDNVYKMCNSFGFLGLDLLQTAAFWNGALILAVIVFLSQVLSMIVTNKINGAESTPGCNQNILAIGMGAFSLFISFTVPAAFPLYWLVTALFAPLQALITKKYFGPLVMNAKAEAARNAKLKIDEKKIIDDIIDRKGVIELKPEMPNQKVGGSGIQGGSSKNRKGGSKQKNTGKKNNSSDYQGKKK